MNNQLSVKKYPLYKDSGVEWLGDVPEHWEVRRLKEVILGSLTYGANEIATDSNLEHPRFIRITDFSENEELRDETFKSLPPDIAQKYLLKEGDILLARSGATVGKTFHFKNYKGLACYAGYLIKARPNKKIVTSNFLSYYTKSSLYNNWKSQVIIKSTIENISAEKYGFFLFIPLPPLAEQKAIADYLDTKTAQIDRKIDLLFQKAKLYINLKQSLINETVTRGLDKSVPMKDSGIEWIEEVPEHWEVVRNKQIFQERSILSSTGKETLLTVSHITGVTPRSEKNVNMFMAETMEGYKICHQGDLIINTMWAWMGALGTSNYFGICSPAYNVYMPVNNVPYDYRYFDYLYRTPNAIVEMTRNSKGIVSSRLRLYAKEFFQIETPLPPLSEQKVIADYLDTKTAQIDQIIQAINAQIEKLKELRKTLINDVVTGKIKVV